MDDVLRCAASSPSHGPQRGHDDKVVAGNVVSRLRPAYVPSSMIAFELKSAGSTGKGEASASVFSVKSGYVDGDNAMVR